MKKSTKYFTGLAAAAALFSVVLAGCGNKDAKDSTASAGALKVAYDNKDKAVTDGTLNIAMVSDTPFKGVFAPELSDDLTDSQLSGPIGVGLFNVTNSFKIVDGGPANIKLDKAAKTATITIRKGLTWSDGKKVVAKDLEFPYEVTANPAYGSQRYTDSLANIKGLADYHTGKAKTISGITFPNGEDGDSIKLQFDHMTPGMWQSGSGYYLENAEPYHYLKDVKPADLAASKQVRQAPLGFGPFKVDKIVAGQSVTYVRNPYWDGSKAKLKRINATVVSTSTAAASLKAKKYDVAYGMPATAYPTVKGLKDYVQTGAQSLSYSYIAFNLGHYDTKNSVNVMDRKTPLQDKALRQAMGYAMNVDEVNKKFNNGLATRANSTIVPVFKEANNPNVKGYPLDINKANKLLDKAGYKWDSKHEYRTTPEGKDFKLVYLARSGNANAEAVAQNYIQQWKKIGVKVALYHDRLTDFNSWGQIMTSGNNSDWDLTGGAWSVSSDPSQMDLYSKGAPYNFGHFTTNKLTNLLNAVDATSAINPKVRQKAFYAYQEYMQEQAGVIPTSFSLDWYPVNSRVIGWTNANDAGLDLWAKMAVSANATK